MSGRLVGKLPAFFVDLLILAGLAVLLIATWLGAAPDDEGAQRTARHYLIAARSLPAGTRITRSDVGHVFSRVVGADTLVQDVAELIGRFTTRELAAGAPFYSGSVRGNTPAPEDTTLVLFPVVVQRGLLAGIVVDARVIFVRDSVGVIDAGTNVAPFRGFPVQAVVPMPQDTTVATVFVRAPVARVSAMQPLTGSGWYPIVLGRP